MPLQAQLIAPEHQVLSMDSVRQTLTQTLEHQFTQQKVLILIPDHTRTIPLPVLFPMLVEVLHDVKQLDFMVALGTHPPLSETSLCQLVGITPAQRQTTYRHIGLLNHAWDEPETLTQIGILTEDQIKATAGDCWHQSLSGDVPININKHALTYDQILILGPTFPHEVVGFSGGAKYLFPGISGPEMINVTHWLGALITILDTIGIKETPVRDLIHLAREQVTVPITLISLVVTYEGLAGVFIGDTLSAWSAAADVSAERHIQWVEKPFQSVLSVAPPMYDELWTAAKAMYKLESAIADGGEVIVYAPQLDTVSHVHGRYIYEAGYHVRDYFLKQWDKFQHIPKGVLAHGTHLRGSGRYANGIEQARIKVTLATQISAEDCQQLALGYRNPDDINISDWEGQKAKGRIFVSKAGEMLYRVKPQ